MKRKLIRDYTWLWLIAFSIAGIFNVRAQTTLSSGDLMFIGVNSDPAGSPSADEFLLLFLEPVVAGTEIYFTDFGYVGGTEIFQRNSNNGCVGGNTPGVNGSGGVSDGIVKWTATSAVPAGTQLLIRTKITGGGVSSNIGSASIFVETQTAGQGISIASTGEVIHAFQGSFNGSNQVTSATLLSSMNYRASWETSLGVCEYIPSPSKDPGTGFEVEFSSHKDNGYYSGGTTGDKATMQAAILNTASNWVVSDDAVTLPFVPGSFVVGGGSSPVSASITSQTNVDCNGNSTGSLTATAADGDPNYSYSWSNASSTSNTVSTTNTINGLSAGTYTVTITDNNGTTATASSTVTQPTVLSAGSGSVGNVTCNGGSDGWIAGYGTGGTNPYTYSWNNGGTDYYVNGVSAGTYTLTVTDANGCTATTSRTITEPTALALSSATTATSIDLTVGGGASPYTYSWSNGATNQDISSLSSGTYTVTVTDNNGCTASLSATAMASELVCYNGLPDTLESSSAPSGGSGNFVYQWQTSADGATAWTAAPGKNDSSIYIPSVGVTDTIYFRRQVTDTTCSATAYSNVKAIFVLDSIGISGTPVAATCGASDGSLNTTVSGGQAPYTYAWSNSATTQNISSVAAGTYTITVTDNLGCVNSKTFIVPGASSVVAGAVVDSNVTCNGLSDGGATASVSGGATPYTYLWSNAATTASITGVAAGTYTVTISDNNGCTSTASASITQPTTLVASSLVDSNVSCNGGFDGGATASATGGTFPYSYAWSNSATTASITGVAAGTYSVIITDNNGCTASSSVTITEPATLVASTLVDSNVTCNGLHDGGATASVTGGTAPYTYMWSNAATTASITGVSAGTYTVTITDNKGCSDTSMVTVTEPAILVASTLVDSNVTCNGLYDGGATASATGGTAPYTYMWSNAATTASITGIDAGTYTVTVTDNNGCTSSASATITEPATLVAAAVVDSNETCTGAGNGGLSSSASGGTSPYTYNWSNGAITASVQGITSGTYTVTVTDAKGCTASASQSVIMVDTVAPFIQLPISSTDTIDLYLPAGGGVSIFSTTSNIVTSGLVKDSCGIDTAYYSPDTLSCGNVGYNAITLHARDINGNTSSLSFHTELKDTIKPTVVTQDITVYLTSAGYVGINPSDVDNGSYDNCAISGMVVSPHTIQCNNMDSTMVTLTITDVFGNKDSAYAWVTVLDTIRPTYSAPDTITYYASAEVCGAKGTITTGATSYNAIHTYSETFTSGQSYCPGSVQYDNWQTFRGAIDTTVITGIRIYGSNYTDGYVLSDGALARKLAYALKSSTQYTGTDGVNTWYVRGNCNAGCAVPGEDMEISVNQSTCSCASYTSIRPAIGNTNWGGVNDGTGTTCSAPTQTMTVEFLTGFVPTSGTSIGGSDNCSSFLTQNSGLGDTAMYPVGYTINNYTVSDSSGNTRSFDVVVEVVDTISPDLQIRDFVAYLDITGSATIQATDIDSASSDVCGLDTIYLSQYTFACADTGTNSILFTASDIYGNSSTATATVIVKDTISPAVLTQNISVYLDATGNTSILASYLDNGTTDACGIDSLHLSKYDFDCSNVGDVTVQLYATDVNGNTAMANATVTVIDSTKPVLATRNVTAYLDATGNTSINATFIDNGTTDECGLDTLLLSKYDFDCSNVGANTITFTAKDVNNNSISTTATVTVVDTISPVAAAQNISVYLDATGNGTITAADVDNGSADACGLDTLVISQYNFDCSHVGANNVTLTATDVNSNSSSETIIVTAIDTIKPVVLTQNTTIYLNGAGQASIVDADIENGSTDACGVAGTSLSKYNFDCSNAGTNTVYLSVTDVNGNVDSASATVTVLDTISPVAKVQSITAYLDASGTVVVDPADVDNGSSDNCGFTLSLSQTTFDCTETGLNLKTFTITDASGNKDSKDAWITIKDTISPELHLYKSLTVSLDQFGSATIAPTQMDSASTDNCSNLLFFTASKTTFNCSNLGPNTITVTAYDNKNNSTTGTAIVTVKDYQAPVVVTQNITAYLDGNGSVTVLPIDVNNGTTDNCTVDSLWLDKDNFSCANLGQNIVKLYAKDQSGNSAQANAVITVLDTISPVVAAQNITIYLDANGAASITTADINNGSADNCAIQSLSLSKTAFDCSNVGANTVTLTATDASANSKIATATVTVMDTISPMVATQNITVSLDANGAATITAADIDNGSSDNCGIQSMSVDVTTFDCTDLGANTVTLTVLDNNGNSTTATATVTVVDNTAPIVATQNITVYLDANGAAAITTTDVDNGSADNCSIQSMSLDVTAFDCSDLGSNVVTLSATDGSANTSSATAIVTVMDTISPMVAAQNITIYLDANGAASITTSDINNGSADNCAIQSLSLSKTAFDCSNVGVNTVTLTATDASANSKAATATVTVMDTISPMVATQNITVSLDANGAASITAAAINNGSSDACGIQSMSVDVTTFDCTDLGANTVTLTVLDNNGNSTTATATVTVVDNTAPIVATQNITIYLDANGDASIVPADVDNNSSDNCGITNYSLDISVFDCADLGQNLVMLTATDASNNSSTKSAFVTVLDTIDPTIDNLPATITAYAPANQCAANVQWPNITGSDNCGVSLVNVSKANGGLFSLGTTTVNVSVADASGNTVNQSFNVVVVDTVSPTVSNVPTNYTVVPNANSCDAIVNWIEPVAIDNCGGVTWTKSHIPGSVFQVGTTPVTYTATDSDNNSTTVSFVVVVTDQLAPSISNVPANITVSSDAGSCDAVVNFTAPTVNDNCTGATLNASHTSGSVFPIGITTVVFTAVDGANNTTTASFTITVEDSQKPVVSSMPANDTVGACGSTYTYAMPVATDNCSAVSITQTSGLPSGSIFPAGVTVNTFRISDANGNDTVVSFAVVVVPQGMPNLPNVLEVCANMPAVELTLGQNIVWSGNGIIGGTQFNPASAGAGRHQLSYTYTDNMGCTVSGSIYVTVLPVPVKPVISRIGSTTLSTDNYNSYQWYRNGVAIPGATGKTYSYTIGGNYQVMVANSSGCESYSDGMVIGTSGGGIGLEENQLSQLEMYPNPADDLLTFDLKGFDHREMEVVIFNTAGKKVFEVKDQTSAEGKLTIDLGHLPDATYIVRIQAGDESAVKRVVIY